MSKCDIVGWEYDGTQHCVKCAEFYEMASENVLDKKDNAPSPILRGDCHVCSEYCVTCGRVLVEE